MSSNRSKDQESTRHIVGAVCELMVSTPDVSSVRIVTSHPLERSEIEEATEVATSHHLASTPVDGGIDVHAEPSGISVPKSSEE